MFVERGMRGRTDWKMNLISCCLMVLVVRAFRGRGTGVPSAVNRKDEAS